MPVKFTPSPEQIKVLVDLCRAKAMKEPHASEALACVEGIADYMKKTDSHTIMELEAKFRAYKEELTTVFEELSVGPAVDMFLQFIIRGVADISPKADFYAACLRSVDAFVAKCKTANSQIASLSVGFIPDEGTILIHGYSRSVMSCLSMAAGKGKHFQVLMTTGGSIADDTIQRIATDLYSFNIIPTLISDAAVAYYIRNVTCVLVGAELVVESGGIINRIGTYQIAQIAKSFNKPLYVATESFRFSRFFPLGQEDVPVPKKLPGFVRPPGITHDVPMIGAVWDYTPPTLISLLFTNLGPLTPAAVSEELIKLHE